MIGATGVASLPATNLLHTVMLLGYVMTLALLHRLARGAPDDAVERSGVPAASGYMGRAYEPRDGGQARERTAP